MADKDFNKGPKEPNNKKKVLTEQEFKEKIETQQKKLSLGTKIKILSFSFKWQAISFIILTFALPIFFALALIFSIEEYKNLIDTFTGTPFEDLFASKKTVLITMKNIWDTYLSIFNFGWLGSIFGFSPSDIAGLFVQKLNSNNIEAILYTTISFTFITLTFFNLISIFVIKKYKLSKKGSSELSELTKKLRKTYSQAHTMKSTKDKEIFEKKLKGIKKKIMSKLEVTVKENPKDPNKIYYTSTPIFKIMTDKIDSMSAGMIAGLTNKYWQKKITINQVLVSWEEVIDFLFEWQYNGNQLEYIKKLNILNDTKLGLDVKKFCNYGKTDSKTKKPILPQYSKKEQKDNCMKIMCIAAYFKNYPKDPFFAYFETFDITFNTYERKLIKNGGNWVKAIEEDTFPSILPMALLLPRMKDLDSTFNLSKLVYETLGDLTNKMSLLQNQAIEDKGMDNNSPYKHTFQIVEDLIVSKVLDFIEILFFNIYIDYTQNKVFYLKKSKHVENAWPEFLRTYMNTIQNKKSFLPEEKKEIEVLIRTTFRQKVQGISRDYHTNNISTPLDAEVQVARLKRLINISLFLDFYRDFLSISNKFYFYPQIKFSDKENDILSDTQNLLKKQLKTYYEYYYDYLNIGHNIRMKRD